MVPPFEFLFGEARERELIKEVFRSVPDVTTLSHRALNLQYSLSLGWVSADIILFLGSWVKFDTIL